jgi:Uma2 family endonuclease
MVDQTVVPPAVSAGPDQVPDASRVSAEEYMARYAHDHYEWAQGSLVKVSPTTYQHDEIVAYLLILLKTYFSFRPVGVVKHAPFVMRIDSIDARREPDLQVILKTNPGQLTETAMVGPADLCIEVVSEESVERDYGKKFVEYEKGGVREYWIVDPIRELPTFYRLAENGLYRPAFPDAEGIYETPLLPGLRLHAPTLWQKDLPDVLAVVDSVRAMLGEA